MGINFSIVLAPGGEDEEGPRQRFSGDVQMILHTFIRQIIHVATVVASQRAVRSGML